MSVPFRCWSCRQEIVKGRCPCSEPRSLDEARNGLLRGIVAAFWLWAAVIAGVLAGMLLVGNWRWGW